MALFAGSRAAARVRARFVHASAGTASHLCRIPLVRLRGGVAHIAHLTSGTRRGDKWPGANMPHLAARGVVRATHGA